MPRQPLAEISGNSNYRDGNKGIFGLTSNWRSHIVGIADFKKLFLKISIFHSQQSRILYTKMNHTYYENEFVHQSNCSRIVSGPCITVSFMKLSLVSRLIQRPPVEPRSWWQGCVKIHPILRIEVENTTNWLAKKMSLSTEKPTAKRVQFAKGHGHRDFC